MGSTVARIGFSRGKTHALSGPLPGLQYRQRAVGHPRHRHQDLRRRARDNASSRRQHCSRGIDGRAQCLYLVPSQGVSLAESASTRVRCNSPPHRPCMNARVKAWLREWTPPRIAEAVRNSSRAGITFEGPFTSWEEARIASGGYDDASILDKVRDATLKVKHGEAAYERDS